MQILSRDREQNEEAAWIALIGDLAGCISIKRPKEVVILIKFLPVDLHRILKACLIPHLEDCDLFKCCAWNFCVSTF